MTSIHVVWGLSPIKNPGNTYAPWVGQGVNLPAVNNPWCGESLHATSSRRGHQLRRHLVSKACMPVTANQLDCAAS